MTMIPYAKHQLTQESIDLVNQVLHEGWIARGPMIHRLEDSLKSLFSYKHCIACSSGSSALEIVLKSLALDGDDEVIVPTITWVATASAVAIAGAKPVFADICPATYCITADTIKAKITPKTKAILVVHFAGLSCDMAAIWEVARQYGIQVIEDAAHAFGSKYLDLDQYVGASINSYASIFSFHPAKNITSGEGGIVVTSHQDVATTCLLYRNAGVSRNGEKLFEKALYRVEAISSNYHMSDVLAAIAVGQLSSVHNFVRHRQLIGRTYNSALSKLSHIQLPVLPISSSVNLYIIRVNDESIRDALVSYLHESGIGAYFHYPPLHLFENIFGHSEPLQVAESYSRSAITLPMGTHITKEDAIFISNTLISFLAV
jgi:dTDP-4-amino-4,6-dideoxygalactose transaminase